MSLEKRFLGKHVRGFLPTWNVCQSIEGSTKVDASNVYQRIMKLAHECDIAPQTAAERVLYYINRLCSLKMACQLVKEEYAERKPAHEYGRRTTRQVNTARGRRG